MYLMLNIPMITIIERKVRIEIRIKKIERIKMMNALKNKKNNKKV